MIRLIEIPVALSDGAHIHPSMGSVLHGALMERIPPELAEQLHGASVRPYRQSIFFDRERGEALWQITSCDDRVTEAFREALPAGLSLELRQKDSILELGKPVLAAETSFEALADQAFGAADAPRGAQVFFDTPTSFKRAGSYVIFPDTLLIFQSLLLRWNALCPSIRLEEENITEKLASSAQLSRYNMHSAVFSVEGVRITCFAGSAHLRFHGTDAVRRILGLLISFAPYIGIGIKTALGMGAVHIAFQERREPVAGEA